MTGQEAIEKMAEYNKVLPEQGLGRITALLAAVGNPQEKLRFVHVGGTNGKGSVSAMLYAIINRCEYRGGLFTYPHLYSMHERIQVDGALIPDDDLGIVGEKALAAAKQIQADGLGKPSELELSFVAALLYFHQRNTDLVVVEVVDGGKQDLTNGIGVPAVTVLTNMSSSPEELTEKLGILKEGTKAVLYQQKPEIMECVSSICGELSIPLQISNPSIVKKISQSPGGQKFSVEGSIQKFSLTGEHQLHNVALALETVDVLKDCGFGFSPRSVYAGLSRTVWPGRFERVHISPDFILDGCDNPQSVEAVTKTLEELYPGKKIFFVGGVLEHQDYEAMVAALLPLGKRFLVVTPNEPYAVAGEKLAEYIQEKTAAPVISVTEVEVAVDTALELASAEDVICTWGTLGIVGEIRHILGIC